MITYQFTNLITKQPIRCYSRYSWTNYGVRLQNRHKNAKELEKKELLDSFIRVDHAGEVGAQRIYEGQLSVLRSTQVGNVIQVIGI